MNNRDCIKNIKDIMLCLQTMIRTRYGKKTKIIFTKGLYKSAYTSFYKSPYVWQFYCEDKVNRYVLYLLKNEKIVKKDIFKKEELIDNFYKRLIYFFYII
jgi:hypothetical protein